MAPKISPGTHRRKLKIASKLQRKKEHTLAEDIRMVVLNIRGRAPARHGARVSRPMPHSFCFIRTDSTPEGRVWSAATSRRSEKRVLAEQRQLAAVFRRDKCLVSGAPWQSRQQAAGVGQYQAVDSGDQSPHSKRALRAMRQKLYGIGRPARKSPGFAAAFVHIRHLPAH